MYKGVCHDGTNGFEKEAELEAVVPNNNLRTPRVFDAFTRAFARQNLHFEKAIQSLDSLNDQIVQFIFTPKACETFEEHDDCMHPKQREALKSSMALMRRLLLDAQTKFRKMVDDNKQLALRIDGDIQCAHEEVNVLRAELADTNRRINQLTTSGSLSPINDNNGPSQSARCLNCSHPDENQVTEEIASLRAENEKLAQQNWSFQREVEELRRLKESFMSEDNSQSPRIQKLESELQQAKDAMTTLKADRKRLKAEKFDLLNQMKQLYGTLEDKERELRDFIRNYEQRMKESDESLKQIALHKVLPPAGPNSMQLSIERDATEREKWSILKHARDESERSVSLCAQLGLKESQLKQVQEELAEARKQLSQLGYYSDQESVTSKVNGYYTPGGASTPVNLNGRGHTPTSLGTGSVLSSTPTPGDEVITPVDDNPSITVDSVDGDGSPIYAAMSVCNDSSPPPMPQGLSRSAEELSHVLGTLDLKNKKHRRHGSKGTWGSISRVFSRSRSRRSVDGAGLYDDDKRTSWSPYTSLCASPLAEEAYSEKLRLLEEAQGVPMERWRANTVVAWLELSLGMPQYAAACAENIKSGKILLQLTDAELDVGLSMSNPMHKRKLRLAIEEHRDPASCLFPKIGELTHMWVCGEWLPSLGLGQYVDAFANHLVDGRVLERLGRKELEKYLGVTRKFHQISILHGVQLLRMVGYDKQLLIDRRSLCEVNDSDPLVWTTHRFIKWAMSIDLGEYAENLRESGVHGALVVLEHTFTADTMAAALGIPQTKNIIRRHLTTELEALVQPARLTLEQESQQAKLGKRENFSRSYASGLHVAKSSETRRSSLRGSLSRALGIKVKHDVHHNVMSLPPPVPRSPQHLTSGQPAVDPSHRRVRSSSDFETITVTSV